MNGRGNRDLRRLTKSMLRAPWAASMFGLHQASRWLAPSRNLSDSASEMDDVSDLLEERLGEAVGGFYRTGKHLQEGMVDALFDLADRSWAAPEKTMSEAWRAIDQGWSRVRRTEDR